MVMSIVHRATGIALYAGTLLLAWWFVAAAMGDGPLSTVHWVFGSWFGQFVLFGYTWALFHHLLGGVRYFLWDTRNGFSHQARFTLAWANIGASIVLTLVAWAVFVWF